MKKECFICGKSIIFGNTLSRRGQLKKKGGTGSKTTRVNKRMFAPNLQKVRIMTDGKVTRVYTCTKCLKAGKVKKYVRPQPKLSQ